MTTYSPSRRSARSTALEYRAQRHFGAFTWQHAIEAGYPSSTLAVAIDDGLFRRLQPTVYTSQLGPVGIDTRRAAALLAAEDASALAGRSALAVFDCSRFGRDRASDPVLDIGVPRRTRRRFRRVRVRVSRAAASGHVVRYRGHRVTSFAWTVTDLGTELEPEQIANVIQQGRLRRLLDLDELQRTLDMRGRFAGGANVRAALAMYLANSAGTRSGDEDTVYGWVKELVRQPPFPNTHVRAGDQEFEIDIPFRSRRLCVEVDGPLHDDPEQQARDRVRDAALRAAGFRVLRLHWRDIRDRPEWCKRQLRAALGIAK